MKLQTILTAAIFGLALTMSGCASKSVQATDSGFFKDYKQFEKTEELVAKIDTVSDLSKYNKIIVVPVEVISAIEEDKQTQEQKKLYKEISQYLTDGYKKEIKNSPKYTLTEEAAPNTLKLETGISAVEVHFDDDKWNQFSPISIGLNVVSYNSYMDENVRILGEKRLIDASSGEVLSRSMKILKDTKIIIKNDFLEFEDIKPALDSWLEQIKKDFAL